MTDCETAKWPSTSQDRQPLSRSQDGVISTSDRGVLAYERLNSQKSSATPRRVER